MKTIKTLMIIALAFFTLNLSAQKITMGKAHFKWYEGTSSDVSSGTTVKTYKILVNKDFLYSYDIVLQLDSAGDGTDITVELEGSMDNSIYYDITSDNWGVSVDTTIRFNNFTASTQSIASHTITASGTDTEAGTITGTQIWDTASANGDTATYSLVTGNTITNASVNTVATQTVTITEGRVAWQWLQIKLTGLGAGAASTLDRIDVAIRKD